MSIAGFVLSVASAFLCFISPLFLILVGFILALAILANFWYMPLYFKSYEIKFLDNAIIIKRGVFIKMSYIMPFSRLIYAESFSTPMAKAFGLSATTLKAARSIILVPEMRNSDVNALIKEVSGGNFNE